MKIKDKFDRVMIIMEEKGLSNTLMDLFTLQVLKIIASESLSENINNKVEDFINNLKEEIGEQEINDD